MNEKITQQQFLDFMQIHKRPIINVDTMDWLIGQGFFVKPAAINHHGNHTGGLFEHSMMVAQVLVEMTQKFDIPWTRPESPYIVGMLHDVCKLDDYFDENASDVVVMGSGSPISKDPKWTYNPEHLVAILNQQFSSHVFTPLCSRNGQNLSRIYQIWILDFIPVCIVNNSIF